MHQTFEIADTIKVIAAIGAIITISTFFYKLGHKRARTDERLRNLRQRFEHIYSPVASMFMTLHFSSCQITFPLTWKDRPKEIWSQLKQREYRLASLALIGKRYSKRSFGVDFGGAFPFDEIRAIVEANMGCSDPKLVNLVSNVDRSNYEDFERTVELMNLEEQRLFEHIWEGYHKLAREFSANH